MPVVEDKLLGKELLHTHGGLLGSNVEFPVAGFIMNCGTARFYVTIDCTGALITTQITTGPGTSMGLLLALTYSA